MILLRVALGLALAALALATLATLIAFGVAGSALNSAEAVRATTLNAGLGFTAGFLTLAFTFGALARWLLRRAGRNGGWAHAAGGAAAGMLFALIPVFLAPPETPAPVLAATAAVLTVAGAALLPLARRLARAFGGPA